MWIPTEIIEAEPYRTRRGRPCVKLKIRGVLGEPMFFWIVLDSPFGAAAVARLVGALAWGKPLEARIKVDSRPDDGIGRISFPFIADVRAVRS